ncbi:unnamed protein product [uncultured bacterium]|nr:unnamed protein product [uncultured bacterium]
MMYISWNRQSQGLQEKDVASPDELLSALERYLEESGPEQTVALQIVYITILCIAGKKPEGAVGFSPRFQPWKCVRCVLPVHCGHTMMTSWCGVDQSPDEIGLNDLPYVALSFIGW